MTALPGGGAVFRYTIGDSDIILTPLHKVAEGDTLTSWDRDVEGVVLSIDVKARTYSVQWNDEDAPKIRQWKAPYNLVRRLRRDGEILDWEQRLLDDAARCAQAGQS